MANAYRYDYIQVDKYQETPEGYLIIPARIARVGIQEYRRADGSVQREYRPPEEVGSASSLESFKLKPVTLEHPPTLLNSENVSDYAVGHIGEQVHFDGTYVTANVAVLHKDAVAKVKAGEIRELSCGYQVAWDPTPGRTDDGTHYDGCQRQIVGNHLALTKKGRAGPEVRLLMDSAEDVAVAVQRLDECGCDSFQAGDECECQTTDETPTTRRKRKKMARLTIDGAEFEVDDAVAAAVAASQRADAAEKEALQHELEQLREDAKKAAKPDPDEDMEEDEDLYESEEEEDDEDLMPMGKKGRKDKKAAKCDSDAEYEGRIDALYAYIDELEAKLNDGGRIDSDDFEVAVDERVDLIRKAEQILGSDYDYRGRSNREIMVDALSATFDSADLDERSDDYVAAKFDTLLELQHRTDSVRSLERAIAASKPQDRSDYASGYVSSLTSAWQKPLVAQKEGN